MLDMLKQSEIKWKKFFQKSFQMNSNDKDENFWFEVLQVKKLNFPSHKLPGRLR